MTAGRSRYATEPAVIQHGPGCVDALGAELAALDCERALVVTGRTVGATAAVMDPIRAGLGDRLADVFAETTPEKRLSTALAGATVYAEVGADAVVAVGGGSSHDVARAVAVLATRDHDAAAAGEEFAATGTIALGGDPPPMLVVPTTFAGADLSQGGGLTADPATGPVEEAVSGGTGDPALFPDAAFYDPDIVATTPRAVLATSAMNGFDKGIETLYARDTTPVTDATAMRGLGLFADGLIEFADDHEAGLPAAVEGLLLVQYGISRPDARTASVIHALGKLLANAAGVRQGVGHAVVAPATLAALFAAADGRRDLLATALGVADAADPAAAVVDAVRDVRDALGVPTRIRDLEGVERADLAEIAAATADHRFVDNGPADLAADAAWFEGVLQDAW